MVDDSAQVMRSYYFRYGPAVAMAEGGGRRSFKMSRIVCCSCARGFGGELMAIVDTLCLIEPSRGVNLAASRLTRPSQATRCIM